MASREAEALSKEMESLRYRPKRVVEPSRKTWLRDPKRVLFALMFLAIAILLAARPMGLAPDDFSYLTYFETADWFGFLENSELQGYSLIIEEPLWQLLVHVLSSYLDPESAFRFVIFCSVAMYAWAFRNAHSSALLFVLFSFFACSSLFTQLYFNQMRQGFAISLFLAFLSLGGWGYLVGAVTSGLLHTSQLVLLPSSPRSKKMLLISVGVALIGIIGLAAMGFQLSARDLDLGRREDLYIFEGAVNYRFFIVAAPLYFGMLGFIWYEGVRLKWPPEPILLQSVIVCALAFVAFFVFEAGARLLYLLDVVVIWNVSRSWRGRVPVAAWLWAGAQLALGFNMSLTANFDSDTPWGRAAVIYTSWY